MTRSWRAVPAARREHGQTALAERWHETALVRRERYEHARAQWREVPPALIWRWIRQQRQHRCTSLGCCGGAMQREVLGNADAPRSQAAIAEDTNSVLVWLDQAMKSGASNVSFGLGPMALLAELQKEAMAGGNDNLAAAIETVTESVGKGVGNLLEPITNEAKGLLLLPLLLVGGLAGLALLSGGGQAALAALPGAAPAMIRAARPL